MRGYLLQHLLDEAAVAFPDKTAVSIGEESISYAQLADRSRAVGAGLSRMGVAPGDRVGLIANKSLDLIVALFGVLRAGAVYVPLDQSAPVQRTAEIAKQSGMTTLVADSESAVRLLESAGDRSSIRRVVAMGELPVADRQAAGVEYEAWGDLYGSDFDSEFAPAMSDASPAYILHTSGSTGSPKGVVISHLNALSFVRTAAEFFGIRADDRFGSHAPLHFDLSVFDIFVAFYCGATVVLCPEVDAIFPVKIGQLIERERLTVWNSVSSVLVMLAAKGKLEARRLDSMRIVHFSGDVMPAKYLRLLKAGMPNATFYNIYGQTEANSSMAYRVGNVPADDSWRVPIGRALPNFETFAMNEAGRVVERPGEEGELYVSSSTVAGGYWGKPELTQQKFVGDPRNSEYARTVYRTGDLVRLDDDGAFVFVGRSDNMIKSRGYRIELEEVEAALLSHSDVERAVVVPIPDELIGNRLVAVVVRNSGGDLSGEQLSAHCGERVPHYMVPGSIEIWQTLPLTSSGKVDRVKIRELVRGMA